MHLFAAILPALILPSLLHAAPPANPLDAGAAPAERFIISSSIKLDPTLLEDAATLSSPMLAKLAGVMAVHTGPDARLLRSAGPGTVPIDPVLGVEHIAYIHVQGKLQSHVVELGQGQNGQFILYELTAGGMRAREVLPKPDVIAGLITRWNLYAGDFKPLAPDDPKLPLARPFKLDGIYRSGTLTLDQATLGRRLLAGGKTEVPGTSRILATQELFVRLPKNYNPTAPAGLLVWIDPNEAGLIPGSYESALDNLNIIAIGAAGMGNSREMSDRLQLALDGLATASHRFHIDPDRIYVSGLSGGGRLSSTALACFPEHFNAAIAVVGVSCYENLPTGTGGFWSGGFRKPQGKLFARFQQHPLAIVTGDRDFNKNEIKRAFDVFTRDRCNVKLFEWEDLGHTIPSPDRMQAIFEWIDAPAQTQSTKATESATRLLTTLQARHAKTPLTPAALKTEVAKITTTAPWSPPAWEAIKLLSATK
jgi:dienelactone hydrolase